MNFPYTEFTLQIVRGSAEHASMGFGEDYYQAELYASPDFKPKVSLRRVELYAQSGPHEALVEALRVMVTLGPIEFDGATEYVTRRYEVEHNAFVGEVFEAVRAAVGPENVYVHSVPAGTLYLCDGRTVMFCQESPTTEAWSVTEGPSGLSAKGLLEYLAYP